MTVLGRGKMVLPGLGAGVDFMAPTIAESITDAVATSDPMEWQERVLGATLYSNQIDITTEMFDVRYDTMNVLGARHSGKTFAVGEGLAAMMALRPGTQIIATAPIASQAGRILRYVRNAMEASDPVKGRALVDWEGSSAYRLAFKNKSVAVAVSGQEKANTEGDHGSILVVDEAHLVSYYSISSKIGPMIMRKNGITKTIKIGVSIGKGHFYKSVMAKGARNCICPWNKAEMFLAEDDRPHFYHGVAYPRDMVAKMPLEYKYKYFPDRPDLHLVTSQEVSVLDWETQYEMIWVDDVRNMLSDDMHVMLGNGKHLPLMKGVAGETYVAGIDTAPGSSTGATDTDWTVLSIWRVLKNGEMHKVASYRWRNDVLEQKDEIWQICNPKTGVFRCQVVLCDNSGYAAEMIPAFSKKGMPIIGIAFGSSGKSVGSDKNWKNLLADNFEILLQSKKIFYPNVDAMRVRLVEARGEEKSRIECFLEDYFEWGVLQRIRGKGKNDKIAAPEDVVEDDNGGGGTAMTKMAHDDAADADMLAVYAGNHPDQIKALIKKGGLAFNTYEFPIAEIGGASSTGFASRGAESNPWAARQQGPAATPGFGNAEDSETYLSNFFPPEDDPNK